MVKPPVVLSVQIQRLEFDKVKKTPRKNNAPVQFDKTVYLDRFMAENKTIINTGKSEFEVCNERIAKLKDGLEYYTSFGKERSDLCKSLRATIEFYKTHAEDELTLVDVYEDTDIVYDPRGIEVNGNAEHIIKALEDTLAKVSQQISTARKKLADYEDRLKKCKQMDRFPYDLHAVIMHSGTPEFGHYWAFIHDKGKDLWRKYNDEDVTEVSEEEVFREAIGDCKSSASAYFLIYVARGKMAGDNAGFDFALSASTFVESKERGMMHYYASLLPHTIKKEVADDNLKLDMEALEVNSSWVCKKALEMYKARHERLAQARKCVAYSDWHFVSNLESRGSSYYRYVLLDSVVRELTAGNLSLDRFSRKSPLLSDLTALFKKKCAYPPASISLSHDEIAQIEAEEKVFRDCVLDKKLQDRILHTLSSSKWNELLNTSEMYLSTFYHGELQNKQIVLDLLRILVLRFMSLVNSRFMVKDVAGALSALKYISSRIAFYISNDDPHIKHAKRYIEYTFGECKRIFDPKQAAEFAGELQSFAIPKTTKPKSLPMDEVIACYS